MEPELFDDDQYNSLETDNIIEGLVSVRGSKKGKKRTGLVICCCCCCCCCLSMLLIIAAIYFALCKEWIGTKFIDDNYAHPFLYSFNQTGVTATTPLVIHHKCRYGTFAIRTGGEFETDLVVRYQTRASIGFNEFLRIPDTKVEVNADGHVEVWVDTTDKFDFILTCLRQNVEIIVPRGHPIARLDLNNESGLYHVDLSSENPVTNATLRAFTNHIQIHNLKADYIDAQTTKGHIIMARADGVNYPVNDGVIANRIRAFTDGGNVYAYNVHCDEVTGCTDMTDQPTKFAYTAVSQLGVLHWIYDDDFRDGTLLPSIYNVVNSTSLNWFEDHIISVFGVESAFKDFSFYLEVDRPDVLGLIHIGGPEINVPESMPVSYYADTVGKKDGCYRADKSECPAVDKLFYGSIALRRVGMNLRPVPGD